MYYIYEISDFVQPDGSIGKIGVSEEPKVRVAKQGYSKHNILEEHTCIYEVSRREQELQRQYGYPVDAVPYHISRSHWGSKAGKIGGNTFSQKRNDVMSKIGKLNKGKTLSEEHKQKLSKASKGRTHTEKSKRKIAVGNIGKVYSDETKRKISKSKEILTYEKAEYIRAQYKRGKDVFGKRISMARLGKVFGVCSATIHGIVNNKTYTTP